jgi:acyl dehydratase
MSAGARTTTTLSGLTRLVGSELGVSTWLPVTQQDIDRFASVTRDQQWLHVDPARAAGGPFEATIAHGYLVLSLCSCFVREALEVSDAETTVNYGVDRVRFTAPVPAGSRLRGSVELVSVERVANGRRVQFRVTVELERSNKPACVAETIALYLASRPLR